MKVSFDEKHIKWGFTAFLVILCSIIVFFAIYRMSDVSHIVSKVISILTPFIYGISALSCVQFHSAQRICAVKASEA